MNDHTQKIVDAAAPAAGWLVWWISHAAQINAMLQGVLLLVTIVATLIGALHGAVRLMERFKKWRLAARSES